MNAKDTNNALEQLFPASLTLPSFDFKHLDECAPKPDDHIIAQVMKGVAQIEKSMNQRLGGHESPLLLSAGFSTDYPLKGPKFIADIGLNDITVEALTLKSNGSSAWERYRLFMALYGETVLKIDGEIFENIIEEETEAHGYDFLEEWPIDFYRIIIARYKAAIVQTGSCFPQDPIEQLLTSLAALAAKRDQTSPSLKFLHPAQYQTQDIILKAMVGGLRGSTSGTVVSRHPKSGAKGLLGRIFAFKPENPMLKAGFLGQNNSHSDSLQAFEHLPHRASPQIFNDLKQACEALERNQKTPLEIEFCIDDDRLWIVKTKPLLSSPAASVTIAVDMAREGLITQAEAVMRINPLLLEHFLHPTIDPGAESELIATGRPASPGAATGVIVFTAEQALEAKKKGVRCILVQTETGPDDIAGMRAAQGVLTVRGGMTSHAAVVARGMGVPCVTGAMTLRIDIAAACLMSGDTVFRKGDTITIDGSSGQVLKGRAKLMRPRLSDDFEQLMQWADDIRRMRILANADNLDDARAALAMNAQGIGLCRTEHMFFKTGRLQTMREMMFADDAQGRSSALARLLPIQRADFTEIFQALDGKPVTIRLLDPPLHEFLPRSDDEITELAAAMNVPVTRLRQRMDAMLEVNPMLGQRGCRLAICYPDIVDMQARAIFEAALMVLTDHKLSVSLEIMVPLVWMKAELDYIKTRIAHVAETVMREHAARLDYKLGTMIELPRAALCADEIAQTADFFSFGTNDLTQTTLGISRDDASAFLQLYQRNGFLESDPFTSLDVEGVGKLIQMACEKGRAVKPDMTLGVCGEHGGDPASIDFFERIGLDYISCSPFRVPVARLAAAQAFIRAKSNSSNL